MSQAVEVYHGRYLVNEYRVEVTQEMRDRALAFAMEIKGTDNQFSRLLPSELQERRPQDTSQILRLETLRTAVGKLGELVFLSLLNERGIYPDTSKMFTIYEGQKNVDPFDFETAAGKTVDVKTGFRSNHSRLLVNIDQFTRSPKDYYVGVKLEAVDVPGDDKLVYWDPIETAVVKGYAEKAYLAKLPTGNYGESPAKGLSYDKLMGIDRLLSMF